MLAHLRTKIGAWRRFRSKARPECHQFTPGRQSGLSSRLTEHLSASRRTQFLRNRAPLRFHLALGTDNTQALHSSIVVEISTLGYRASRVATNSGAGKYSRPPCRGIDGFKSPPVFE